MAQSSAELVALALVLPIFAGFTTILRIFARRKAKQCLLLDDWLICVAVALLIGFETIPTIILAVHYNLGNHQKSAEPASGTYHMNLTYLLIEVISPLQFEISKLSVLFFYRRVLAGHIFRICNWVVISIVVIFALAHSIAVAFKCLPVSLALADPKNQNLHCINSPTLYETGAGIDIVTDVMILVLPWLAAWKLSLQRIEKMALAGIFGLGILATGANIAHLGVFLHAKKALQGGMDRSYEMAPIIYWSIISSSLVIIAASLVLLKPILQPQANDFEAKAGRSAFRLRDLSPKASHRNWYCRRSKDEAKKHSGTLPLMKAQQAESAEPYALGYSYEVEATSSQQSHGERLMAEAHVEHPQGAIRLHKDIYISTSSA